jgi:hypothetical protein
VKHKPFYVNESIRANKENQYTNMLIKILPVIDANTNNHNTDCIPYSSNSIKLIHQISPFPAD